MPTVTLNRKTMEKLVGQKLTDAKLKDRVPYLGASIEALSKEEVQVEIEPNRPDLLSEQGFARALSSFIGINTGLRKYDVKKGPDKVIAEESVKKVRPYTSCAVVKGLKFNEEKIKEVIQIQEKLHVTYGRNRKKVAIGIYPFEKIKTPIRFIGMNPRKIEFRPLESSRKLNGLQILSQHPTGRNYGHLLEGAERFPIFIDANNKILSMPPIINSHDIGKISNDTKDVFIECSGFDYEVLAKCLNMIVTALADMGGEIYSMEIDLYGKKVVSPVLKPKEMKINLDYINKRLGLSLKEKDVKKLLARMGYGYVKGRALVPAYRADVLHQIDLVEDIAIAYGYENIDEEMSDVATVAEENKFEVFKRKTSEILAGLGLIECKTFTITNKEFQSDRMNCTIPLIELANALNQEYSVLAAWNIPLLMEALQNNKHHEYPQNVFSIGRVFKKDERQETKILEQERLACVLCSDDADYTRIKQVLDYLFRMIGKEYSMEAASHDSFIPGRAGRVLVGHKKVAYIGEINPVVLSNWELDMPAAAFELNLSELFID
ncbi:phenylalanine--tRNA ligase subunit beta [Candidatus Woesearchaeota archaeon]|nr:phenylalanine--tRNA ligase subunit beta [Candidatus Woesearchaeota archaeon]